MDFTMLRTLDSAATFLRHIPGPEREGLPSAGTGIEAVNYGAWYFGLTLLLVSLVAPVILFAILTAIGLKRRGNPKNLFGWYGAALATAMSIGAAILLDGIANQTSGPSTISALWLGLTVVIALSYLAVQVRSRGQPDVGSWAATPLLFRAWILGALGFCVVTWVWAASAGPPHYLGFCTSTIL